MVYPRTGVVVGSLSQNSLLATQASLKRDEAFQIVFVEDFARIRSAFDLHFVRQDPWTGELFLTLDRALEVSCKLELRVCSSLMGEACPKLDAAERCSSGMEFATGCCTVGHDATVFWDAFSREIFVTRAPRRVAKLDSDFRTFSLLGVQAFLTRDAVLRGYLRLVSCEPPSAWRTPEWQLGRTLHR